MCEKGVAHVYLAPGGDSIGVLPDRSRGLYRGWVSFSRPSDDPQNHKVNFNVSVDPGKAEADVKKGVAKIEEKISEGIDRAKQAKNKAIAPAAK